jgi:lipid-A-disaccharide synthase
MSSPKIVFCAGEASGDAYAAELAREIKALRPDVELLGIGGALSEKAGVRLLANSSKWGAMGIAQASLAFLRVYFGTRGIQRLLGSQPAAIFIPIDFGFANVRLARRAKEHGWKVLYFMPPGSWRRDRQGKDLGAVTDQVVTPFDWSEALLKQAGVNVEWFGHPLKQILKDRRASETRGETIAVLPGSRTHEVHENLSILAKSVGDLKAPFEFAIAPTVDVGEVGRRWKAATGRNDGFTVGDTRGVLLRARAGLICSGTATLEAALCGCPMVVFYELTKIMLFETKLLRIKRPKFIALPNVILDRMVVPEHAEKTGVKPADLRADFEKILIDGPDRDAQLAAFEEISTALGGEDAITRTAELAVRMVS